MKLIQHLERKLSWRKKKKPTTSLAPGNAKSDLVSRKAKKSTSAAIRVSDTEFSQYIRFANLLQPVPTSSVPSYEIVNIRTRSPFQASVAPVVVPQCSYQSPSSGREAENDMHIYDRIDCARLTGSPDYLDTGRKSKKYSSPGPTTVTSSYRRNRIKTNPWCSSPWASKKSFQSTKPHYTNIENPYESIDNLNWQESKENLPIVAQGHAIKDYYAPQSARLNQSSFYSRQRDSSPSDHRTSTYLKGRIVPHHHPDALYPQSALGSGIEMDHSYIAQAPSPEFLNESHQICSEISNYFRPFPQQKEQRCSGNNTMAAPSASIDANKFDSMETIDLTPDFSYYPEQAMSVWSLTEVQQSEQDTTISSGGTPSCETSPKSLNAERNFKSRKQTLDLKHNNNTSIETANKRKRPESIYSVRQAKKVDRLKNQLKEVVHAAIHEAKRGDTKRI